MKFTSTRLAEKLENWYSFNLLHPSDNKLLINCTLPKFGDLHFEFSNGGEGSGEIHILMNPK